MSSKGVANWTRFSAAYRADFYRMYTLDTCRECRVTFKICITGMKIVRGNVISNSFSYCYLKLAVKTCLFLTMLIEGVAKTGVLTKYWKTNLLLLHP